METRLEDVAGKWFGDQPKFNSLKELGEALMKAFPSQKSKISKAKKQKPIERQAIKYAKKKNVKALKAAETAKPTPTIQDIGIFDPALTSNEPEVSRFNEAAKFLQHLQQDRHQYRESDLLTLLPTCLEGPAFDIWFKIQKIMNSARLDEWIEILGAEFAAAAFATPKVKTKMACVRCEQSFNFKGKLREHVRELHVEKPVNSSLS